MVNFKKLIISIIFLGITSVGLSQLGAEQFEKKLTELSAEKKGLNDDVRVDLSGLPLYDFITALADEHQLNVSVDNELNQIVSSNFYDLAVKDVFLFLVRKYDLEVDVFNSIIIFNRKPFVEVVEVKEPEKKIDVSYNSANDFLTVRLANDSLPRVARAITDVSNKNIILAPDVKTQNISAYILNRPFEQVMEMVAKSNGLSLTVDEDNNFYLEKGTSSKEPEENRRDVNSRNRRGSSGNSRSSSNDLGNFTMSLNPQGFLDIKAYEADAAEMINEAAEQLNINYFMYNTPESINTTLIANGIGFETLLDNLFKGEKYTYKKTDDLVLIGEHTTLGLRSTELVQLENRTIETVLATLPAALTANLEVKEFVELNGFVVAGSKIHIQEFKDFIYEIDRVVPVIQIEVLIVQYNKSYNIQTGLQAILDGSDQQRTTQGVLFPNTDVQVNASSVNSLIDAFNGLGFINLGKVSRNFYLNLQALENNSLIKVSSTPKLVTLNGHEANSAIGETNYYFEQSNTLINSGISDNILQSGVWKPTEANLSVRIKPYVSKDEFVTLEIYVEKSSFLGRAGETAPPGKATQKFESIVRVKNNEMILLGGLDELENENSGSGTPLLSRIPIIKWLFSSRNKRKEKSKLHIFIKPTVVY